MISRKGRVGRGLSRRLLRLSKNGENFIVLKDRRRSV